jgi:hypothetical protein
MCLRWKLFLLGFNNNLNALTDVINTTNIYFHINLPGKNQVLPQRDRKTDRQTDKTELIVAFRSCYMSEPKNWRKGSKMSSSGNGMVYLCGYIAVYLYWSEFVAKLQQTTTLISCWESCEFIWKRFFAWPALIIWSLGIPVAFQTSAYVRNSRHN